MPPPHPAPEVTSRHPWPDGFEIPAAVRWLRRDAEECGWYVRLQYARGMAVHVKSGKPTSLVQSVAMRFARFDGRGAVAVYQSPVARRSWTWVMVHVFSPDVQPFAGMNISDLREYLENEGKIGPRWIAHIKAREEAKAAAAKLAEKNRRKTSTKREVI